MSDERPAYWKHERKHGHDYVAKQLHFANKETAIAWMREHHPQKLDEAMVGWADDAPVFTRNIWADIVDPAPVNIPDLLRKASQTLAINRHMAETMIAVDTRLAMLARKHGGDVRDAAVALRDLIAKAMDKDI